MDATIASVAAGVITGGIAVVSNLIISARASGKTEGAIKEVLNAHAQRIENLEEDDKQQWSKIGEHTSQIGYLQGKVNGKAQGRL